MRTIKKRIEPTALREWRARNQADPQEAGANFGYDLLRQDAQTTKALTDALWAEQGGLCAYTGRSLGEGCHVEHLRPQSRCKHGEDVDYGNMVACWPAPNMGTVPFGAHAKADWPPEQEEHLFVSPLREGCKDRFQFRLNGEISPVQNDDVAAKTTIAKLRLDHKQLTALRRAAIEGVLGCDHHLRQTDAARELRMLERAEAELDAGQTVTIRPYTFAISKALEKHIHRLSKIRRNLRNHP